MPKSWSMVDSNFPTFTGNERPEEQIRTLVDYMYVLVEELKWQLENLDSTNWNSKALQVFQTDTTADVSEQVAAIAANMTLVTNEVAAILNRMSTAEGAVGRLENEVSWLEKENTELRSEVEALTEEVTALEVFADEVGQILRIDEETGAVVIGGEGITLNLIGQIYANDTEIK